MLAFLEIGARGRNRTGTTRSRGILNPLCLPISPPGQNQIMEARAGIEPA